LPVYSFSEEFTHPDKEEIDLLKKLEDLIGEFGDFERKSVYSKPLEREVCIIPPKIYKLLGSNDLFITEEILAEIEQKIINDPGLFRLANSEPHV
jgi:hypothetical protein